MSSAAEERAIALVAKAEKKLKGGMFSFGNARFEEGAELYQQAAKQYQLDKKFSKAAECYEQVVECHNKLGSALEMAMAWREAGNMYEKADNPQGCTKAMDEAKNLYAQEGRLSECAKLAKKRAEIFEKAEIEDLCVESYAEAAELFDGEGQNGETRNCKLKIAQYKAKGGKDALSEAVEIYEEVAKVSLESNLLKWSVKQYYLKALLCQLVMCANNLGMTVDDVREKRAEYCGLDPTFEETREDNMIVKCLEGIEESDAEIFATACSEFDEITKLDSWQTMLLLRAKKGIDDPEEGGGDDPGIC